VISRFEGRRAAPVEILATAATALGIPHLIVEPLDTAVDHALTLASLETPLVVTGSIFTAGEARTRLVNRHGARPLFFGTQNGETQKDTTDV
jgi:folylpolyglutamate synthase/dihydropteroate synthase